TAWPKGHGNATRSRCRRTTTDAGLYERADHRSETMNTIARSLWLEWEQAGPLIVAAVEREGSPSLTAYAATLPQADLLDLARLLAIVGVHSGHLQLRLWQEA